MTPRHHTCRVSRGRGLRWRRETPGGSVTLHGRRLCGRAGHSPSSRIDISQVSYLVGILVTPGRVTRSA